MHAGALPFRKHRRAYTPKRREHYWLVVAVAPHCEAPGPYSANSGVVHPGGPPVGYRHPVCSCYKSSGLVDILG